MEQTEKFALSALNLNTSAQSYLWHPFPGQCKIEHIIITFDFLRRIIFIVFIHSSGTCRITHDCINSFTFFNREQPVTSHYCEIPLQITEYVRVVWEKRGELLFISLKRWGWSKKLGVKYSKRVKAEIFKSTSVETDSCMLLRISDLCNLAVLVQIHIPLIPLHLINRMEQHANFFTENPKECKTFNADGIWCKR